MAPAQDASERPGIAQGAEVACPWGALRLSLGGLEDGKLVAAEEEDSGGGVVAAGIPEAVTLEDNELVTNLKFCTFLPNTLKTEVLSPHVSRGDS